MSYLGVADLAAAAVRADRRAEARELLQRIIASLGTTTVPRLEQFLAGAGGILADFAGAEAEFNRSPAPAAVSSWPLERAELQLDYGEWLRRSRRINEAKPIPLGAFEAFHRVRAEPLAKRAEAELRACGVRIASTPDGCRT